MAKLLQLRGGTTQEHSTFTGASREVTVDTDKDTLVVHDGSTVGGSPLLKVDDIGVTVLSPTGDGSALTGIDALPAQTGNAGKFLTTDATNPSWEVLDTDANITSKGLYEMSNTINSNYTIGVGNNAISAGPITVEDNVSVTVLSGSTWVIA